MHLHVHEYFSEIGRGKLSAALVSSQKQFLNSPDSFQKRLDFEMLLNSYFLGNWITDMVQVIEPNAYANFCDWLEDKKVKMQKSNTLSYRAIKKSLKLFLKNDENINEFDKFVDALKRLFTKPPNSDNRETLPSGKKDCKNIYVGDFLKELIFLKGYFKFVRPIGKKRLLPFEYYKYVYDNLFTQYSPHKHFDRWPIPNQIQPESLGENSNNNLRRHKHIDESVDYLDKILTKIDYEWAKKTFCESPPKNDNEAKEWCYHLALLGTAMHTIEDFFAHTNYVEELLELAGITPSGDKKYLHDRRRRHFDGSNGNNRTSPGSPEPAVEINIVGGYFDFTDTIWSCADLLEEHFSGEILTVPHPIEDYKQVIQAIDTISRDTSKDSVDASELIKNSKIVDYFGDIDTETQQILFVSCVRLLELNRAFRELNPWNWTIIESLKNIVALLNDILTLRFLQKYLPKWLLAYCEELAKEIFGGNRIGCHSLMNKDGKNSLHFDHAANLARGLHAYIIDVLLRWQNHRPYYCTGFSHIIYEPYPVNWKQLLDFFLCHPECISNENSSASEIDRPPFNTWYNPEKPLNDIISGMTICGEHGHILQAGDLKVVNNGVSLKDTAIELEKYIESVFLAKKN